jgi:crotonobetainyl-CoA:carnitine CoA-transferase CaiB-like acyl-CoA transferase
VTRSNATLDFTVATINLISRQERASLVTEPEERPLSDVTVLDLTSALAGPFCTLQLAGLGARVIKVEPPGTGDGNRSQPPYIGRDGVSRTRRHDDDISLGFLNRSRNKLSVTLDLKAPGAAAVFADLARVSDVVMNNFSPGTADRLGVGFDRVHAINPKAVYCSLSGFGAAGGKGRDRAFDTIIQALSGLMMTSGEEGSPPVKVGIPIADTVAPLFATIAILAALNQARRTGLGQHVDVSMLGALTALVSCEPFAALEQVGIPVRTGETVPRLAPFGIYRARDSYVAICGGNDRLFARLAEEMGRPELSDPSRFKTRDSRADNWQEVDRLVSDWVRDQSVAEVVERLAIAGVPAAPVRDPIEAASDPEVMARGETAPLQHPHYPEAGGSLRGPGIPAVFSGARTGFDRPAPALGEHNSFVFGELLGYDTERQTQLGAGGVIGQEFPAKNGVE